MSKPVSSITDTDYGFCIICETTIRNAVMYSELMKTNMLTKKLHTKLREILHKRNLNNDISCK